MNKMNKKDPLGIRNVNFSCFDKHGSKREYLRLWKKQRLERGFDDTECWNLDCTFGWFIVPRLKVLRRNHHGYPDELHNDKNWCKVLDEMIWAFETVANHFEKKPTEDDYKRIHKGLKLFAKYYCHLWD